MAQYDSGNAYCCAIGYVRGFTIDNHWMENSEPHHKSDVKEAIKDCKRDGKSILMATLNTDQLQAEKLLLSMGFKATSEDWAYRSRVGSVNHRGVKIYTLTLYKKSKY